MAWRIQRRIAVQIQQARERGLIAPGEEKFYPQCHGTCRKSRCGRSWCRAGYPHASVEAELDEVMRVFATTQRSRIPVYRGNADTHPRLRSYQGYDLDPTHRERRLEETSLRRRRFAPSFAAKCSSAETKPASEFAARIAHASCGHGAGGDEFGSILGLVTIGRHSGTDGGGDSHEFDVVERPLTLADGALIFDAALMCAISTRNTTSPCLRIRAYATVAVSSSTNWDSSPRAERVLNMAIFALGRGDGRPNALPEGKFNGFAPPKMKQTGVNSRSGFATVQRFKNFRENS